MGLSGRLESQRTGQRRLRPVVHGPDSVFTLQTPRRIMLAPRSLRERRLPQPTAPIRAVPLRTDGPRDLLARPALNSQLSRLQAQRAEDGPGTSARTSVDCRGEAGSGSALVGRLASAARACGCASSPSAGPLPALAARARRRCGRMRRARAQTRAAHGIGRDGSSLAPSCTPTRIIIDGRRSRAAQPLGVTRARVQRTAIPLGGRRADAVPMVAWIQGVRGSSARRDATMAAAPRRCGARSDLPKKRKTTRTDSSIPVGRVLRRVARSLMSRKRLEATLPLSCSSARSVLVHADAIGSRGGGGQTPRSRRWLRHRRALRRCTACRRRSSRQTRAHVSLRSRLSAPGLGGEKSGGRGWVRRGAPQMAAASCSPTPSAATIASAPHPLPSLAAFSDRHH